MRTPTTAQVYEVLKQMTDAWKTGDGQAFGAAFSQDAHFVAFDGTVLVGPGEIARYHQAAFDHYLQGTELIISVESMHLIAECALLVFTRGAIHHKSTTMVSLAGDSVGTTVVVFEKERVLAQAFHNTRKRPITGETSAAAWKQFDASWNELVLRGESGV